MTYWTRAGIAALAGAWAGGCQSGVTATKAEVPASVTPGLPAAGVSAQPIWVNPTHDQSPDQVAEKVRAFAKSSPPASYSPEPPPVIPVQYIPRVARAAPIFPPRVRPTPYVPSPAASVDPPADPNSTARLAAMTAAGRPAAVPASESVPEGDETVPTAVTAGPSEPLTLEQQVEQRVHEHPRDLQAQLDWQLICILTDNAVGGASPIGLVPDRERELIAAISDGLSAFRSDLRTESDSTSGREIQPLLVMARRLQAQGQLDVPVLCFCTAVNGFGKQEPMDVQHLTAGTDTFTIVYCEVENFVTRQNEARLWETSLSQRLVIYSDSGTEVWHDEPKVRPDLSRSRRRDLYMWDKIKIPKTVPAGHYTLKVTVEDRNAGKQTEATAELRLAPPMDATRSVEMGPVWLRPSQPSTYEAGSGR